MRLLTWILVPALLAACSPAGDAAGGAGETPFESIQPHQPAPHDRIRDGVTHELYERVWTAIDPGDGYRDYRYLEFDWVMWNGVEVLRRSHRFSPWEGNFRVETELSGQTLVAVGNWGVSEPTQIWMDGERIQGDSAVFLASRAERMFELDANTLLLPFRWADFGVHAQHMGMVADEDGASLESIQLTFQSDGSGAEPKVVFWVDPATNLPTRSFEYRRETDTEPNTVTNWVDWTSFGALMLSTRRTGDDAGEIRLENIRLEDTLPPGRFRGPSN